MKVRFGPFTLDAAARRLVRDDREIRVPPKAFDLLVLLIERRPAVVDKSTLREHLWPGTHVVDASLSNLVADIRAVTGSDAPPVVRTVHGVGYAFGAAAEDVPDDSSRAREGHPAPCWVVWRDRVIELASGENLVGRDRACAVWIDESGVSRRHASIHVPPRGVESAEGVILEDLHSTNGTFVRGRAVTSPTRLADGDKVRIGPEVLLFRSRAATDAPTRRVRRLRRTDAT